MTARVLLIGGPAGAGKSTVARAWCAKQDVAVHLELDDVRARIVSGLADPLDENAPEQPGQWRAAVDATCAMARAFVRHGMHVVIDDLMSPRDVETVWAPLLAGLPWQLIVLLPSLDVTLERGRRRGKQVPAEVVRRQYAAYAKAVDVPVVDSSSLTVSDTLRTVAQALSR